MIELGTVTLGAGGSLTLHEIGFQQLGSTGFSSYLASITITAADSGQRLYIPIPNMLVGGVPFADRNLVDLVRLEFLFTGGSGTSVGINAVVNPEPGTVALFALGLLGLAGVVRSRRRRRAAEPAAEA